MQIQRIGKYKSAGDQLLRKEMSEPQREQLTALLDDIYDEFLSSVGEVRASHAHGSAALCRCESCRNNTGEHLHYRQYRQYRAAAKRAGSGDVGKLVHVGHSCAVASTVVLADCNVDSELQARGKTKEEVAEMLDAGYYDMEKLAAGGWLTALKYADELEDELKTRTGGKDDEFAAVPLSRYQNSAPRRHGRCQYACSCRSHGRWLPIVARLCCHAL